MPNIHVERVVVGQVFAMNCYLVDNMDTGELFIVDPGAQAERIICAVGSRNPVAVLLTHAHYDHIAAADDVCRHFSIPLYLHRMDVPKLTDPMQNISGLLGRPIYVNTPAALLEDEQRLDLAGMEVVVWHTPGHSAGSCCFLLPEGQGVLCGDTLFDGGYGRTDFEDGNFELLKASLRRLMCLSPRQIAYPGHEGTTFTGKDEPEASR